MPSNAKHLATWVVPIVLVVTARACAGANRATPESYRVFNLNGIHLQQAGNLQGAAEQYRKAIQLNPNAASSHNNLAIVLKELNELTESEQEARTALSLKPKRGDYHYNLGIILQKEDKLEPAQAEFRAAIALDGLDVESRYRLAQVLLKLGQGADAEQEVKVALLLKPNEPSYHNLLGDILMQQDHREEDALNEYRKVEELQPGAISADLRNKIDYLKQTLKIR